MKKIWQKSLASMVSAALCLTAFVGCLTVNAATTYTGTIASDGVAVEATAKEATIDLVVTADVPNGVKGMACAGLKVTTGYGKLTNAEVTSGNAYVETKVINGETDKPTEIPDIGADGQFIVTANDTKTGVNSFNVRLTFTAESVTAGATYPVNVTYLGSKDIGAGNWDDDAFTFDVSGVNGIHVHNVVYTSNDNGTHTSSCDAKGCPGFVGATEACVDANSDKVCDKCSYNMAPELPTDVLFRVKNASMVLEGEILMNFNVMPYEASATNVCTTFEIEGIKEFGILVWLPGEYDENNITYNEAYAYPYTDGPVTSDGYGVRFPLNSKQLNVDLHIRGYVMLDDGTIFYGKATNGNPQSVITYSAVKYSQSMLSKPTTNPDIKGVLKAMLNYGAAAEIYFATRAGETVPTAEKLPNYILDEADRVVPTAEFGADVTAGLSKDGNESVQSDTSRIKNSSLMLDEAVYLNYTVDLTTETEKTIKSVRVLSWNEVDYAAAVASGGALIGTETAVNDCVLVSGKIYRGESYGVASNKLRDDVHARAYVEYTDGSFGYTRIFKYSAEYHAKSQIAKPDTQVAPTLKSLLNALMIYADKAIVAFG